MPFKLIEHTIEDVMIDGEQKAGLFANKKVKECGSEVNNMNMQEMF